MVSTKILADPSPKLITSRPSASAPPSVTVVMTHFGCEEYLAEAVQSVLSQTHQDLELWLADDASESDDWLQSLAPMRQDPRLRLFQSDHNVGTYRLKRLCIEHLNSPYIAFHDADDASEPERISVQVQSLEKGKLDVIGTGYTIVNEQGDPTGSKKMPWRCNLLFKLGRVFIIHHPTTMVRREVFDEIGSFDGHTRIGADVEFALRASHHFKIGNSRKLLYRYRLRSASLTGAKATGFGSEMREAYSRSYWERENARRNGTLLDFNPVPYDTHFVLKELPHPSAT